MLQKRIEKCEKKIEEIKNDKTNYSSVGIIQSFALENIKYWQGQRKAYRLLLAEAESEAL